MKIVTCRLVKIYKILISVRPSPIPDFSCNIYFLHVEIYQMLCIELWYIQWNISLQQQTTPGLLDFPKMSK